MSFAVLRSPREFQLVYQSGRRINGRYMTAFVLPNKLGRDRFGITASRKVSGLAVERNRMKRLLRESIRISFGERTVERSEFFDWVLNARRALLTTKLSEPLEELRGMASAVVGK